MQIEQTAFSEFEISVLEDIQKEFGLSDEIEITKDLIEEYWEMKLEDQSNE